VRAKAYRLVVLSIPRGSEGVAPEDELPDEAFFVPFAFRVPVEGMCRERRLPREATSCTATSAPWHERDRSQSRRGCYEFIIDNDFGTNSKASYPAIP
jgi:hypothetical protein